jgi:methylated-DNA-protein-cysteine methyltransferase-like protein
MILAKTPEPDVLEPLFALIRSVPRGKVVTYGQAAEGVEGVRLTARMVGSAMRVAPNDVPWHRVVGAGGTLPIGKISPEMLLRQRELLELEGVRFIPGRNNIIDMTNHQWLPL